MRDPMNTFIQRILLYYVFFILESLCTKGSSPSTDVRANEEFWGDDFISSKQHSTTLKTQAPPIGLAKKNKRLTKPGEPCLSISFTKKRLNDQNNKIVRNGNLLPTKFSRFELLDEIIETRCAPDEGNCNLEEEVVNITLSRPEQKTGFRLVGEEEGASFPCYPLSDADFRTSREAVPGSVHRLLQVARKARNGEVVNVVVVGGSVTHGGVCKSYLLEESDHSDPGPCSWANRFVIWLRQHYKNTNIKLHSLAQPATTTTWILTHFDRVLKINPDLLLVEYGVNDAIVSSTDSGRLQYATMMRAATELLIRKFLEHSESLQLDNAIIYIVLQRSFDEKSYFYPGEVYYPVCRTYQVPVISIRDAIWPNQTVKRENVWVTKAGAHPNWYGHQLITDILAYSWTMAEYDEKLVHREEGTIHNNHQKISESRRKTIEQTLRPPSSVRGTKLKFSADNFKVDVCHGKPILSSKTMVPLRQIEGWRWSVEHGKEGWEYDLHHASGVSIEWHPDAHEGALIGRQRLLSSNLINQEEFKEWRNISAVNGEEDEVTVGEEDGRLLRRSGKIRVKSAKMVRAYSRMQGLDPKQRVGDLDLEPELKISDDWIPKEEQNGGEGGEEDEEAEDDDNFDDDEIFGEIGKGPRMKRPPSKRDGKSIMGIRKRNKKKKTSMDNPGGDSESSYKDINIDYDVNEVFGRVTEKVQFLHSPTVSPISKSSTLSPTSELSKELPFNIISFELPFNISKGNTPTLLFEYLKSWTNYGQAVIWVTSKLKGNDQDIQEQLQLYGKQMLRLSLVNKAYQEKCLSMIFSDHSKLRFSPACSHIRAGTWIDPTVVNGHWEDRSSQIVSTYRIGGLRLEKDPYLTSEPLHVLVDPTVSLFLAMEQEELFGEEEQGEGIVKGEVHVMMVPWSHKAQGKLDQSKFKVSGLYTC